MAAGFNTATNGIASAVTGAYSYIGDLDHLGTHQSTSSPILFQGATAAVYGSFNVVGTNPSGQQTDGVANSVFGQANKTSNSNAAIIVGAGNKITNSFRDVAFDKIDQSKFVNAHIDDIGDALGGAVKDSGGQVMAIGGGNVADYAQQSQLMGVGNELKGTESEVSKLNYLEGFYNKAENVQHAYIIGANNEVKTGNNNIVFGDNHKIDGNSNNVVIGSSDNLQTVDASDSVQVGHNAQAKGVRSVAVGYKAIVDGTQNTAVGFNVQAKGIDATAVGSSNNAYTDNSVAIGKSANAGTEGSTEDTDAIAIGSTVNASKKGSIAIGHNASATVAGGAAIGENSIASKDIPTASGYGAGTSDTNETWKATAAAVSVGDSTGTTKVTRQITNVAAGSDDTDAVNVAQLKKAADGAKTHYYSVSKELPFGSWNYNYNNDMAVAPGSLAAGQNAVATGYASTVTGSYSIVGKLNPNPAQDGFQGATTATYGTFNAVLTDTNPVDGVANSVVGQANMTKNANAAIILGAGNTVTNSIRNVVFPNIDYSSPENMYKTLRDAVPESGGQVMAIGGGNSADYAQQSQLMGVGNELKGTEAEVSKLNYLEGFYNKAENVQNAYIIGANNSVKNGNSNIIIGDKRTMDGKSNNIIIGSGEGDDGLAITVSNALILGNKANVTTAGGIAIGESSIASIGAGEKGYDLRKNGETDETGPVWVATNAAVSVGNGKTLTRQITGVAAGTADTDAVNVAQLKKAKYKAGTNVSISDDNVISAVDNDTTYTAGDNITIDEDNKISATDTTIKATDNALSYDKTKGTLSMTVEDTKGNKATGSVQLSDIKAAVDTNTTYNMTSTTTGESGVSTQTTTISLNDQVDTSKTSTVTVKNDTLVKGDKGLTLNGNTLSMSVEDTAGNKVTGEVDLSGLKVNDTNTTYKLEGTEDKANNTTKITLKDSDNKVQGEITVATKDTRNTLKAGDNIFLNEANQDDGSTQYTVSAVANGKVESGDKGLVSGDTVYKETRTSADGFVTKASNTAGQNIQALDKQTKTNADNIAKNTESINNLNQNVTNIGNRVNNLDSKINKVGAGAAALAALHPQDFDPDDKWDFAAGFGNYRDANAMALGAFYRPDNKTMFSVGGSMGNGENMVNVGVSLKFGKSSPYAGMSKAALVNTIEDMKAKDAKRDEVISQQQKEIEDLKAAVAKLMAK